MTTLLDLNDVIILLEAALDEARKLNGSPGMRDHSVKENRAPAAELSRRLNVLTHLCERAAAETTAVYWTQKGFADPLKDDTPER